MRYAPCTLFLFFSNEVERSKFSIFFFSNIRFSLFTIERNVTGVEVAFVVVVAALVVLVESVVESVAVAVCQQRQWQ
jgi:hypothetical protein